MVKLFPSITFLNKEALNTIEAEVYCVCRSRFLMDHLVFKNPIKAKKILYLFKNPFFHRINLKRNFLI